MGDKGEWVDHIIDTPGRVLGPRASYSVIHDARHLLFVLARYKFAAKILAGKKRILEVGCGDAFGSPIVAQVAEQVLCIDIDPRLIEGNRQRLADIEKLSFDVLDITEKAPAGRFDAAYSIDVLEHIPAAAEAAYFDNLCACLEQDAVFVVGTPNIEAERFASKPGHSPHVNLKDEQTLRETLGRRFRNVFVFSMNDEVVHTGFSPMAHYLMGVGVGLR